ncbi:MAG: hypothetical protein ACK533_15380 [Planctomycetota bacterium]
MTGDVADGPAGAPAAVVPWRRCCANATWTIWLPTLLPVLTGALADCGHCATSYLLSLPLVPGLLAPVAMGLDDAWFFAVGGAATIMLWFVVALVLVEAPRWLAVATQAAAALLVAGTALGYAQALRM